MNGHVHVWRTSLLRSPDEVRALERLLDPAERARAGRFRKDGDRRRFIVGRASARSLLARYAGVGPQEVTFILSSGGKPAVSQDVVLGGIHFNLSHSGDFALCAIADREVGVDVEQVSPHDDMERVAQHFFSVEEAQAMRTLPRADRARFFFRTWVRKEAYLKATGEGLGRDPASFTVDEPPAAGVVVHATDGSHRADASFSVYDLPDFDGHVAAIALAGEAPERGIQYREWIDDELVFSARPDQSLVMMNSGAPSNS